MVVLVLSVVDTGFQHRVPCKFVYFHGISCYESQDPISAVPSEKAASTFLKL